MARLTERQGSSEITGWVSPAQALSSAIGQLRGGTGPAAGQTNALGLPRRTAPMPLAMARQVPDNVDQPGSWPLPLRSSLAGKVTRTFVGKDGQFDFEVLGHQVLVYDPAVAGEARRHLQALSEVCAPLKVADTLGILARMRTVMARRPNDTADEQITQETWLDLLEPYPADIVFHVMRQAVNRKWFPDWADVKQELDQRVQARKHAIKALEDMIAQAEDQLSIAAPGQPTPEREHVR